MLKSCGLLECRRSRSRRWKEERKDGNISPSESACGAPLHDGNSDEVRRRMECGAWRSLSDAGTLAGPERLAADHWDVERHGSHQGEKSEEAPGTTSALPTLSHSVNFDPLLTWEATGSLPVWKHAGTLTQHLCAGETCEVATEWTATPRFQSASPVDQPPLVPRRDLLPIASRSLKIKINNNKKKVAV